MTEATSCGGVVIFRGKILLLYKNYRNKYEGWVLPKGTVEEGEEYKETAIREVREETGVNASIIKYVGKSQYTFSTSQDLIVKDVHWYLMMGESYYSINLDFDIVCMEFDSQKNFCYNMIVRLRKPFYIYSQANGKEYIANCLYFFTE